MNGLMDSTDFVNRNRSAVEWASLQIQPDLHDMTSFLALILNFTAVTGNALRWRYSFTRAVRQSEAGIVAVPNADDDLSGEFIAINLYEFRNVAAAGGKDQDGPLDTPPRTVGPVGGWWNGSAWTIDDVKQPVVMHKVYTSEGNIGYVFSHPNPIRCIEEIPA